MGQVQQGLGGLVGDVALGDILKGVVSGFAGDLGFDLMICLCPADFNQPLDQAGSDSGGESDPDGKEERFVDGICQNGFGPYCAVTGIILVLI